MAKTYKRKDGKVKTYRYQGQGPKGLSGMRWHRGKYTTQMQMVWHEDDAGSEVSMDGDGRMVTFWWWTKGLMANYGEKR